MIHPNDVDRVRAVGIASAERLQPLDVEFRLLPPSGTLKWVQVTALPTAQPKGSTVWDGLVIDITERKQAQLDNQFLNDLDQRLRQLSDAEAMTAAAVSSLGEYLRVDRCLWHEVDPENYTAVIQHNWRRDSLSDLTGTYPLRAGLTSEQLHQLQAGQTLVVGDVTTHPGTAPFAQTYLPSNIGAFVGVPCIHEGQWIAILTVTSTAARAWRSDEVQVLQNTAARLWSIIEQTRAVQALREQEERTRLATEAAELGMWFWNIPQNELVWTERCKALFGIAPEVPMSYERFLEALHPDDRDRTHAAVTQALEQKTEYDIEYRTLWSEGSIHWLSAKGRGLYDANGQTLRMMGTVQNIDSTKRREAERQQAEAALQERSAHIQLLYETTRDLLSTDRPLALVNALFDKLQPLVGLDVYFNYLLDEQQQLLHLMFHGGISAELAQEIEWLEVGRAVCGTVAQQRCQIVQLDLQNSHDPSTQLVRSLGLTAYSCQPLIAQGKLFGTLGFGSRSRLSFTQSETQLFQAICDQIAIALERSELMVSLQQQTAELTQVNRLKDEFLAALSHELRTPLNPILGWTRMLMSQKLSPAKAAEALEIIERNACQQAALVKDLLDVSSIIQGKMNLEFHLVDLALTLNQAIKTVQFAAQAKGITITLHGLPALSVIGDRDRLQQVFWNLLSNAIKFTPNQGSVEVDLATLSRNATRYAQVQVSDTGIGITPEFLPHVFDHFRQADGSTTRKYGGLGLGLAIVRHLVEMHGGTVEVACPGMGQGSVFTVTLPLPNEVAVPVRPAQQNSGNFPQIAGSNSSIAAAVESDSTRSGLSPDVPASKLWGVRILIVDDDPDSLDLLGFLLQQEGAIVTAVSSAAAAIAILSEQGTELLVSDIGLPKMNGYELIRQVRSLPQGEQLPALALTAFARREEEAAALEAGFQAHLAKPIDVTQLLDILAALIQLGKGGEG